MNKARTLILDSEALAGVVQRRAGMAELLAAAQSADLRVVIPTVVLAEVATGEASDAALWHVLGRLPTVGLSDAVGVRAGGLRRAAEQLRRKKRDLTVDAIVAALAIELAPSVVVTADQGDFELLVDGFDVRVSLVRS